MRDHFLDTSKALLIFLVVFGHFLERMIGWSDANSHLLLSVIYSIHMPAFIFISGMLFKDKNILKNILFFLALYLPFQFLFPVFNAIWSGHFQFNWNVFERPHWILWYLMGMMVWTLLTHLFRKTACPSLIALTLALGIGFSPWNNYQYSIGRIFVFFPFFMLGSLYGRQWVDRIQEQKYAPLYGGLSLILIVSVVYFSHLSQYWLYGSLSYRQLKVDGIEGSLTRIGCLLVSALGIYTVFALSKIWAGKFVNLGRHTLPVYLLHGFIVILISNEVKLNLNPIVGILLCFVLAFLSCWILQQAIFDRCLRQLSLWLMKPTETLWSKKEC